MQTAAWLLWSETAVHMRRFNTRFPVTCSGYFDDPRVKACSSRSQTVGAPMGAGFHDAVDDAL